MPRSQPDKATSLVATCGIIGPILFTVVLAILGLFRHGYSHVSQLMSELGEVGAPNALVMNTAGLTLLGLLMVAFAFGLHRGISEGKGSKVGPALIAASGTALAMTGIFPCDPGCVGVTPTGRIHSIAATIG